MIIELLKQKLPDLVQQVSGQLGSGEKETSSAISAAVPVLLGAMAKNSRSPEGARSLSGAIERDHDGGLLDNLSGFLGQASAGPGDGILGHLLGDRRGPIEGAVSQSSGLDAGSVTQLFSMLAPLLMGAAGKVRRERGLGADDLSSMLQTETKSVPSGGDLSGIMSMLDRDGDGSVMDDVAGMLGKFLK